MYAKSRLLSEVETNNATIFRAFRLRSISEKYLFFTLNFSCGGSVATIPIFLCKLRLRAV